MLKEIEAPQELFIVASYPAPVLLVSAEYCMIGAYFIAVTASSVYCQEFVAKFGSWSARGRRYMCIQRQSFRPPPLQKPGGVPLSEVDVVLWYPAFDILGEADLRCRRGDDGLA
jgi:hypothetical protein